MSLSIYIYNPNGTSYDVTSKALAESLPTFNLRFEEDKYSFVVDDLSLTFDNRDGYFSSLWTLPLDASLKFNEATGKGCWRLVIFRGGAQYFDGDLDVTSVLFDEKNKTVATTWLGGAKRAEISAESLRRVSKNNLTFNCELNKRVLTFTQTVASIGLQVGDIIKVSALRRNGNVVDQDLYITNVGASSNPPLTAYQVKVRQGCKKAYTQGYCKNGYFRNLTVAQCVQKCFDAIGIPSGKQIISGTNTSAVVDELDCEGKNVSELLTKLAEYAGCVWWRDGNGYWYFIDRNSTKSANVKDISSLLCEETVQASDDEWHDGVIITGKPPYFAPQSTPRKYRKGVSFSNPLEVETQFTSSLTTLQSIADRLFNTICYIKKKINCEVLDDGTNYYCMDRVSIGGANYYVSEVSQDIRATEYKDKITLTLISESGTLPSPVTDSQDYNEDIWFPYPPVNVELGKGTDDPSSRPSWWSTARALYPNNNNEYPLKKIINIIDDDNNPKTPPKIIVKRLWFLRWQDFDANDDPPDGFEITVFLTSKDPSKPLQHHGYRQPQKYTDGYYYFPLYLAAKVGAPEKSVVIRTYDDRYGLSAYSDEATTSGATGESDSVFNDTTFTVEKLAAEQYTNTYKLTFKSASTGAAKVIPELCKIKICKSEATETSPDLTRKQPPLDTLNYAYDPPKCTESSFTVVVPHANNAQPRVWFRPVAWNGEKMDWTYSSNDGGGTSYSAPSFYSVLWLSASKHLQIKLKYTQKPDSAQIFISTSSSSFSSTPETIASTSFDESASLIILEVSTYNGGTTLTTDITCFLKAKFIYGSNYSDFSSVVQHSSSISPLETLIPVAFGSGSSYNSGTGALTLKFKGQYDQTGRLLAIAFNVYKKSSTLSISPNGYTLANYGANYFTDDNDWEWLLASPYYHIIANGECVYNPDADCYITTFTTTIDAELTEFTFIVALGNQSDSTYKTWGAWSNVLAYGTVATSVPPTPNWVLVSGNTYKITWSNSSSFYLHIQGKASTGTASYSNILRPEDSIKYVSGAYSITLAPAGPSTYRVRLCRVADSEETDIVDNYRGEWKSISLGGGGIDTPIGSGGS